jgi:DNA-binding IclR family transcriptional regulator
MFNEIFGPSIQLLVLDLFIEDPNSLMNLREIARRIDKNPGSVSRVMSRLVEQDLVSRDKIGKVTHVYSLNTKSDIVKALIDFAAKIRSLD